MKHLLYIILPNSLVHSHIQPVFFSNMALIYSTFSRPTRSTKEENESGIKMRTDSISNWLQRISISFETVLCVFDSFSSKHDELWSSFSRTFRGHLENFINFFLYFISVLLHSFWLNQEKCPISWVSFSWMISVIVENQLYRWAKHSFDLIIFCLINFTDISCLAV